MLDNHTDHKEMFGIDINKSWNFYTPVEQQLLTLPEHHNSQPDFVWVVLLNI
jgi:hypothetical protein